LKREDQQVSKCEVCGCTQTITDEDKGEVICARCGSIITSRLINRGVEYYTKDMEKRLKRQRTESEIRYLNYTVSPKTLIGKSDMDVYNTCADPDTLDTMLRLTRLNKKISAVSKIERAYLFIASRMHILTDKLHLNETVIKRIAQLYIKIINVSVLYGVNRDARLAAITYIACREANISRGINEIAGAFNVDPRRMWRIYASIMKTMNITLPAIDIRSYISRYANILELDQHTTRKALEIFNILYERKLTDGLSPKLTAAAIIYIACKITGKRLGQADIAEAIGSSDVALRSAYHRFRPIVQEWLEKSKDSEGDPPG